MQYKTVLAVFQHKQDAQALASAAQRIACQHRAHVTGLYVTSSPEVYYPGAIPISMELLTQHEKLDAETAAEIKAIFESTMKEEDVTADWREVLSCTTPVMDTMQALGNTADLVVLGQQSEDADKKRKSDIVDRLVLASGRPVLIIPANGNSADLNDSVFIAWDGSRESSRAAFDSLPLLQAAKEVTLLTINPGFDDKHSMFAPAADLVNSLARHDVNVTLMQTHSGRADVGAEILFSVKDRGANLLVMGAYGSSRVREMLFGGVTREILEQMQIPVLMSH